MFIRSVFRYEQDRMSNSGSTRNFRDSSFHQASRSESFNNAHPSRSTSFHSGNQLNRGARRHITHSDVGTGGESE